MKNSVVSVLRAHAGLYPLMQPQDAVKLLYQREFGCRHLMSDVTVALARLHEEADACREEAGYYPPVNLGNGYIRVDLRDLSGAKVDALGRAFVRSAVPTGSIAHFEKMLKKLKRLAKKDGFFRFTQEELVRYLEEYKAAGYPPVSHSEEYRTTYQPHYRVVRAKYYREERK